MDTPGTMLDERIITSLKKAYEVLLQKGTILNRERLKNCYIVFRERFGPERLKRLDGEELLNTMHAHGNRDSLVYWLEFKDDEELPAVFGGIAGGSALKFGIYRRKETGEWMTGSPQNQIVISLEDAIAIARKHRDQLISGGELLEKLPINGTDDDYLQLQREIDRLAPDISDSAWGHKYFHMIYPEKLDDFHTEEFQRFHLIKLLLTPPQSQGRFVAAGRYVALSKELDLPLNHLTAVLNELNGRPYRYWRIGTRVGEDERSIWNTMKGENIIAIGWPALGDLSTLRHNSQSKDSIRELLLKEYRKVPNVATRQATEILNFASVMADNDVVLAADGKKILGVGRVTGGYAYSPDLDTEAPHQRSVKWFSLEEWELPVTEGLRTTVHQIRKDVQNPLEIERRLLGSKEIPTVKVVVEKPKRHVSLSGVHGRVQAILERKGQVILYGPPGTGKTYWARGAAVELAALTAFGRPYSELSAAERIIVVGDESHEALVRICTFHPAYGYEDFIEGYRPHRIQ